MTRSHSEMLQHRDRMTAETLRELLGYDLCSESAMPVSGALNAIEGLSTDELIAWTRATIDQIDAFIEGLRGERKSVLAARKVVSLDDWRLACLMEGEA